MARVVSFLYAVVGASALLLACAVGYPTMAQPSLNFLKLQYVQVCELEREADMLRIQKLGPVSEARAWHRRELEQGVAAAGMSLIDAESELHKARFDYESSLLVWKLARNACIERKREYLEALAWQILLAAQTEPPSRPSKPPPRTQTYITRRTPPSIYQTDSAAAAAALMNIIGGAFESSRPPAHVHPPGHPPYH